MLDARAGQLRLARGARESSRLDRLLGAPQAIGRGRVLATHPVRLNPHVVILHMELRQRLRNAVARRGRVFQRVAKRCRGVDGRKDLAPGPFDVGFEALDLAVR